MRGFTKLFSSILTSSVWVQDDTTLRVWIGFLASSDAGGVVEGSVPGLASAFRVPVDHFRESVAKLEAPDPDSRTRDFEGRRLEKIEGGWLILNYLKYREQAQGSSRAPYYREYRRKQKQALGGYKVTAHPWKRGCCQVPRLLHSDDGRGA